MYYPVLQKYEFIVNGECVLTGNKLREGSVYPPATAIDSFRLVLARGNAGDYCIDNLSISHLCLDLPEPDAPGEDGGDTPSSKLIDSIMLNMF
ncbi:MAG: hypothetical protein IJY69_00040 [Clostridia bacterium]|nr:hypothetical protein [Clostridia bacterium]